MAYAYAIENKNEPPKMGTISRHIGNAVPPKLGEVIGLSIKEHLGDFYANGYGGKK